MNYIIQESTLNFQTDKEPRTLWVMNGKGETLWSINKIRHFRSARPSTGNTHTGILRENAVWPLKQCQISTDKIFTTDKNWAYFYLKCSDTSAEAINRVLEKKNQGVTRINFQKSSGFIREDLVASKFAHGYYTLRDNTIECLGQGCQFPRENSFGSGKSSEVRQQSRGIVMIFPVNLWAFIRK